MTMEVICHGVPGGHPPAGHYSHSCRAGGLVFVSGQLPVVAGTAHRPDAPFEEQVTQVLQNLDACLQGAGITRRQLAQVRVYITDMALWPVFDALYAQWIGESRPARAVVGVAHLHYGFALEVEAVALASD
ncbi:RidA family protein [Entomohabitans teleogrylli]|uniref:RidA family protein n=1 Tax=Entomohabitans teleogrylli TaxID=1384589 RepID=UPI00073D3768|nr:RidA family protein [Entomohabitans teleogrylli]